MIGESTAAMPKPPIDLSTTLAISGCLALMGRRAIECRERGQLDVADTLGAGARMVGELVVRAHGIGGLDALMGQVEDLDPVGHTIAWLDHRWDGLRGDGTPWVA